MSKIICDICGTTYQDSADCCPICGCSRDSAAALLGEDFLPEPAPEIPAEPKTGRFSGKKREIFDYDEVNPRYPEYDTDDEDDEDDDYDDDDESAGHNTGLVVLLTVLIVVLLLAAGFLFVKFYLPNMDSGETTVPTPSHQVQDTPGSSELSIPCAGLTLTSGTASGASELTTPGQFFLLHVIASPEDTTDEILFESADESIATVSEDGKITAVSEGETVIYITCGTFTLECKVTCRFSDGTEEPTEATAGGTQAGTTPTQAATDPTVPPTTVSNLKDVVLKLKKEDITVPLYLSAQILLDCDLDPSEVEWSSDHPYIAKVDENGWVTAQMRGTTEITVRYGDQVITCIVRCA